MTNRFEQYDPDVDHRSELDCELARLERRLKEETVDVAFRATWVYLLKAVHGKCLKKWRAVVRRMQAEGYRNHEIADALIRLRIAA